MMKTLTFAFALATGANGANDWSVDACKVYPFRVHPGICQGYCETAKLSLADCPGARGLGECLERKIPMCGSDPIDWTGDSCAHYPFTENFFTATCRDQCREYLKSDTWLRTCRVHSSIGMCAAHMNKPCSDTTQDKFYCKANVPNTPVCQSKCDYHLGSYDAMAECMRSGQSNIPACIKERYPECKINQYPRDVTTGGINVDACKQLPFQEYYTPYCKELCDYLGHPVIYQEQCSGHTSLSECIQADEELCVAKGSSTTTTTTTTTTQPPKPGAVDEIINPNEPRWQLNVCLEHYVGHKFQSNCQAWCGYHTTCLKQLQHCAEHGSLIECVRVSTGYKC